MPMTKIKVSLRGVHEVDRKAYVNKRQTGAICCADVCGRLKFYNRKGRSSAKRMVYAGARFLTGAPWV
jgi:hypothetical protein